MFRIFHEDFIFPKRLNDVFHKNKTLAGNGEITYVFSPEFLTPQICLLTPISEFTIALTSEYNVHTYSSCADPESFVRGGPNLTTGFFVDEGSESKYH